MTIEESDQLCTGRIFACKSIYVLDKRERECEKDTRGSPRYKTNHFLYLLLLCKHVSVSVGGGVVAVSSLVFPEDSSIEEHLKTVFIPSRIFKIS